MMKVKLNGTELVAREEMATIEVHEQNNYRIIIKDFLLEDLTHGKTPYRVESIIITNSEPVRFKNAFRLLCEFGNMKIYIVTDEICLDEPKLVFPGSYLILTKEFKKEV